MSRDVTSGGITFPWKFKKFDEYLLSLASEHGDICETKGPLGFYFLNNPNYIQYVLETNYQNFLKNDLTYNSLSSVLGKNNLLTVPELDFWEKEHALLQPLFQQDRLIKYFPQLAESIIDFFKNLDVKTPIDIYQEMRKIFYKLSSEYLFPDFAPYAEDFLHFGFMADFYFKKSAFIVPWLPTPYNLRFKESEKKVDEIILKTIEKRREHSDPNSDDLLAYLLGADEEKTNKNASTQRMLNELKTFSSILTQQQPVIMAWTFYRLCQNPEIKNNLFQEANKILQENSPVYSDLEKLQYTQMVFQEGMRLYPSPWIYGRSAVVDDEIDGYKIHANKTILISPYTMHLNPKYWPDPTTFNPQRFTKEQSHNRERFVYFPFGGGPRICIAVDLAMLWGKLILSTFVQQFDFELVNHTPVDLNPVISFKPEEPIWIKLKRRN